MAHIHVMSVTLSDCVTLGSLLGSLFERHCGIVRYWCCLCHLAVSVGETAAHFGSEAHLMALERSPGAEQIIDAKSRLKLRHVDLTLEVVET